MDESDKGGFEERLKKVEELLETVIYTLEKVVSEKEIKVDKASVEKVREYVSDVKKVIEEADKEEEALEEIDEKEETPEPGSSI